MELGDFWEKLRERVIAEQMRESHDKYVSVVRPESAILIFISP